MLSDEKVSIHEMTEVVVTILNARNPYTFEHSWRVAALSEGVAAEMGVPMEWVDTIHIAAHLHDIGKVGVPDSVLNKPDRLTQAEYAQMQAHPVIGHTIVSKLPILEKIALYIRHHHERWDGKGYPDGLGGKGIPLGARIIAVADTYDAITTHRPYRKSRSHNFACNEIELAAGNQLCPEVCEVFLSMKHEILRLVGVAEEEIAAATSG